MNIITSECTGMNIQDNFEPMRSQAWVFRIFLVQNFIFNYLKPI